jgi:hypothetical protein
MTVLTKPDSGAPVFGSVDVDTLEAVAVWREDLLTKIERTVLIFQFCDSEIDIEPLIAEVREFKRVVRCLVWRAKE